ncbi:DUF1491 family protein [Nisaea sediminum]|uniref:DUF1491 family protein n=1 Tax=Nisaea sediminum TaxID=2775867 RepID=UPI0018666AD8|nr:DUF1491 family protein [Nisaea sediminum]
MSAPRLKSKLLVQAGLRQCMAMGIMATVVRSGDDDAGAVYLKINRLGPGFTILALAREIDGSLAWRSRTGDAPVPEQEADAVLERERRIDPDIWVLEIEDREGRNPLEGALFF